MIITSTPEKQWTKGKEADSAQYEIGFGQEKQTVRGFGGCFNELGAIALETLPKAEQKKVLESLFGDTGCGFNFCRLSIGANDFAESWYSLNETEGDYEMKHFSIDRDKKHIIPYIHAAMEYRPDMKFFASPWSPPTWMKFPKANNYGRIVRTPENLQAYALYLKKFVEAYKAEKIPVAQIHVQNEPCSTQKFPSCVWDGETLREFIADYLAPTLAGTADIWLGTINGPETDHRQLTTRYHNLAGYVLQDKICKEHIKGVSYQWAGKFAVQQTHDDYPELELVQSESECGDGTNTWAYAMYIFEMMRHYFRNGVSSYIYWNMILDGSGESTWGWRQNAMITIENGAVTYNPEYYLMRHIAAFVKPGARYVSTTGAWSSNCMAFRNPDGNMVVIAANPYDEDKTVQIGGKDFVLPAKSFNTIG